MAFVPTLPDPTAVQFGPSPLLAALGQSSTQSGQSEDPGLIASASPFALAPQQQLISALHPTATPFSPNAPAALKSFVNKYQTLGPQLASAHLPPGIAQALISFDANRVQRGQSPLTDTQTTKVLQSAISGNAATPAKDTPWYNLPVNAYHDVANIAASIPRLPLSLYHELQALPSLPDAISHALGAGNPLKIISALSEAPGLRLIPGAFTLGNLARGDFGEIARHPVQTALDVLPAAHQLGLGEKLAASPLGDFASHVTGEIKATKMGQLAIQAFGQINRDASVLEHGAQFKSVQAANPLIPTSDALEQSLKDSVVWQEDAVKTIADPVQLRTLFDRAQEGNFDPAGLPPEGIPLLERARTITQQYAQYAAESTLGLQMADWRGSAEVFTTAEAQRLITARDALTRYQAHAPVLAAIKTPDPATLPALIDTARPYLESSASLAKKRSLVQGIGHAYAANGLSVPADFRALVGRGDLTSALDGLAAHTPEPITLTPSALERLNKWRYQNNNYTPGRLRAATRMVAKREALAVPARFQPLAEEALRSKVSEGLTSRGFLASDNPDFQAISDYLRDGKYRFFVHEGLISDADLRTWQSEAREFASAAKDAGIDPIFMHRVAPERVLALEHPKPLSMLQRGSVSSPSQIKARTFEQTPYVKDIGISLTHQGMELVNHRNTVGFLKELLRTDPVGDEVVAPFARTELQLRQQYAGVGRSARIINHALDPDAAITARMSKEWERFDPDQLPREVKDALGMDGTLGDLKPYLPKSLMKNLRMFIRPPELPSAIGIPLKAFRVAITGVSPRLHLYNVIGGATMLTASTSPVVFRYLKDGLDLMKRVREGDVADLPDTFVQSLGVQRSMELDWHPAAGTKLGELWQQTQQNPAVGAVSRGFNKLLDKSYSLNGYFDDMYRSMAYLYGQHKALLGDATMSAEDAAAEGEALSRKVLMQWDAQTPIERSILRPILPFYGWIGHIIRYAYHYPIDHPFRAAVTAAFARNEVNDLGTGLPQSLLNSLFLGHPDIHGNVTAVQVGGMNPFRDVANYMTLGGFLSATNPIIATVLQQMGVQSAGGSNLYPNVAYDPTTGRLTASHPNFAANLLYNTIPQTRLLTGLLDRSSELHSLLARDPGAGGRLALSQAGLPILWRQYNVPQEQFKSELARESAQSTALHDAFTSGDWSGAAQFPQLRPVLGQIQALQRSPSFAAKYDTSDALQRLQTALAASVG